MTDIQPQEAEEFSDDLMALVCAVRALLARPSCFVGDVAEPLRSALERFEPWLDQDEDPRSMGWVDDRGRP